MVRIERFWLFGFDDLPCNVVAEARAGEGGHVFFPAFLALAAPVGAQPPPFREPKGRDQINIFAFFIPDCIKYRVNQVKVDPFGPQLHPDGPAAGSPGMEGANTAIGIGLVVE